MAMGLKSGLGQGSANAGFDTVLNVYTVDVALDHYLATYDAAVAAAGAAGNVAKGGGVRQLGGTADTTFAYAVVDTYHTGIGYWPTSPLNNNLLYMRNSGFNAATKWVFNDTTYSPRPYLMHFDPKIPTGSTIVSASLHLMPVGWDIAYVDTFVATLMTNPSDNIWYHQTSIFDHPTSYAFSTDRTLYMAKCSYSWQWYTTNSGTHYGYYNGASPTTPTGAWYPALSNRTKFSDWGSVSDWTGTGTLSSSSAELSIDITDCVQGIVNGLTNNGIMIMRTDTDIFSRAAAFYEWETRSGDASANKKPWIEIKYVTKADPGPFPGGKRFAFVFQTDDGNKAYNNVVADTFAAHAGKYTIYCTKNQIGTAGKGTMADLYRWRQMGNEIGTHSVSHASNTSAYLHYYVAASRSDTSGAGWANLKAEMTPTWLYTFASDSLGINMTGDPRWGKAMACPGNVHDPLIVLAAQRLGYKSLRTGSVGTWVAADYVKPPTYYKVAADSSRAGAIALRSRYARNMMLLANTIDINNLVGGTADNPSEATVKANIRRVIKQAKAQDAGIVSTYSHDLKASAYDVAELDYDELGWILQVVDAEGGCYMTASEYTDWVESSATAVASPVRATQPDTLRFTAGNNVWFKPNGVDNRWLRNIR
jgi:hypothetical protein